MKNAKPTTYRGVLPRLRIRSIQAKVSLLILLLVLLSLCSYILVHYLNQRLAIQHAWLEIVHENELTTAQIIHLTPAAYQGDANAQKELLRQISLFDNHLGLLRQGGNNLIAQQTITVEPLKRSDLIIKMEEIELLWERYKSQLLIVVQQEPTVLAVDSVRNQFGLIEYKVSRSPNRSREEAFNYIKDNNSNLRQQSREFSELLTISYYKTKEQVQTYLWLIFAFYAAGFVFAYIQFRNVLFIPIKKISSAVERLAAGHTQVHLHLRQQDEIGALAQNINMLSQSLHRAAQFANQIGQYQFDQDFKPRSEADILGNALLKMQYNLQKIDEESKRREWHNRGISIFNELSRAEFGSLEDFAYRVIYELINYLNIVHGAFYIIEKERSGEVQIRMITCYAYDRRRFEQSVFSLEEGIIGQAVFEKEKIVLRNLPEGYLQINSGLGESNPHMLLVVPLKTEQEVFGVIELAAFRELSPHEISFVEEVAETVAVSIASVQMTEQTRRLLEEARETAQQMRAQEEEMRQNLEELAATQEALAKREREQRETIERLRNEYEARLENNYQRERRLKEQLQQAQEDMQGLRVRLLEIERQRDELRRVIQQLRQDDKIARQSLKQKDEEIEQLKQMIDKLKSRS